MHFGELTAPEQRVLGCLIEKRWTTPDQYPLSLNALRLACNQSTNRDPVSTMTRTRSATPRSGSTVRAGAARERSRARAIKYRHLAEEALGLSREQLAVLAVLLLRGPQTPGELKARSERMARLGSLDEIDRQLDVLIERGFARRLERRPGQKEDRFEQLLGGSSEEPYADVVPEARSGVQEARPPAVEARLVTPTDERADGHLADRVAALEAEVAALRAEFEALREG